MDVDTVKTADGQLVDNGEYVVVLDVLFSTITFHKITEEDEYYLDSHVLHELIRKLGYNPNRCFFSFITNPKIIIENENKSKITE